MSRKTITKTCAHCHQTFRAEVPRRKKPGRYCSLACTRLARRKRTIRTCAVCLKPYHVRPWEVASKRKVACSRQCASRIGSSQTETLLGTYIECLGCTFIRNDRTILDGLEIDIVLPDHKIAIEVNGPTHYRPIYGKAKYDRTRSNDVKKKELLRRLGFTMLCVSTDSPNPFSDIKSFFVGLHYSLMEASSWSDLQ